MGLIVKRRVTLDLSRRGHQVTVPFSVGDRVAHEVIFTLRDGSELIELPPGVTAAIAIKNGYNDTGCVDACVIDHVNNTITYTPTVEALSIEGNIECSLEVFDAYKARIGSPTFIFAVSEGDNANTESEVGVALKESSSWPIIANTVKQAEDAATSAGNAATSEGNAAKSAEAAAISAGAAAKSAEAAAISAGAAAKSAGEAAEKAAAQVLEKTNENAGRAEDAADRAEESAGNCEDMALGMQGLYELAVEFSEEAKSAAGSAQSAYLWAQQEADRATEYGTSLLVQETGNDDRKVMSQDASTKAFVGRSEVISYIVQEIAKIVANAPKDFDTLKEIADYIASDKTAAAKIESKLSKHEKEILDNRTAIENLPELVQETGDREDAVMSQKAATNAFVPKVEKSVGDWIYIIKGGVQEVVQIIYGHPAKYSIPGRLDNGEIRVGAPKADEDATTKKYVEDHFPRYRHTIHTDTGMGNQSYVAFTLNIYSTSSAAFTNETFISALGEKVNGRTPRISVSGCIVENGTKTQIMGLFFDKDSGFVVVADDSSEIRTGLSTLQLFDYVVQV